MEVFPILQSPTERPRVWSPFTHCISEAHRCLCAVVFTVLLLVSPLGARHHGLLICSLGLCPVLAAMLMPVSL